MTRFFLFFLLAILVVSLTGCLFANSPPIAVIDVSDPQGRAPFRASFDAYDSYDPDDDSITCSWRFGDGFTDSGKFVTHIYEIPGTYTVTLTVQDEHGDTDTAVAIVNVLEGPEIGDFRVTGTRWEPSTCYFLFSSWPCIYVYVTIESDSPYPANVVLEATAYDASGAFLGSNELYWNNTCSVPASQRFVVDGKILFVEGPVPNVSRVVARISEIEACN